MKSLKNILGLGVMSGKKEQIIATALDLFCKQGFKATGIDQIIKSAEVAKMTMYSHFKSKEALVRESLEVLDQRFYDAYIARLKALAPDSRKQLRHLAVPFREALSEGTFWGCPFARASAEFPDPQDPIHAQALAHKERLRALYERAAKDAGAPDAAGLAIKIQAVFEGTMVLYQMRRDPRILDAMDEAFDGLVGPAKSKK